MATKKTNRKSEGGRIKATTAKAGFTKSKRRYSCGGKLKDK